MEYYPDSNLTSKVINWINEQIAREYGVHYEMLIDMPKGTRQLEDSCPIANATGWYVHPDYISLPNGDEIDIPVFVSEWIKKFDQGLYPEYDEAIPEVVWL